MLSPHEDKHGQHYPHHAGHQIDHQLLPLVLLSHLPPATLDLCHDPQQVIVAAWSHTAPPYFSLI
jgi:hypothetical protein